MARINRRFVVGAVAAVLGFHTLLLGAFLLLLGSQRVFVFGALTASTGLLFVGGGLWRAIGAWRASATTGVDADADAADTDAIANGGSKGSDAADRN